VAVIDVAQSAAVILSRIASGLRDRLSRPVANLPRQLSALLQSPFAPAYAGVFMSHQSALYVGDY